MDSEILSSVSDAVVALAAAIGALAAWRGLKTWKDQIKWQINHDLARRVLLATYRYRDSIWDVRRRNFTKSEMTSERILPPYQWLTSDGTRLAMERRLTSVANARLELSSVLVEAEVLWGASLKAPFSKMLEEERRLSRAVWLFLQSIEDGLEKDGRASAAKRVKEDGGFHFEANDPDADSFRKNFNSLVGSVEKSLREKMELNGP